MIILAFLQDHASYSGERGLEDKSPYGEEKLEAVEAVQAGLIVAACNGSTLSVNLIGLKNAKYHSWVCL